MGLGFYFASSQLQSRHEVRPLIPFLNPPIHDNVRGACNYAKTLHAVRNSSKF
nr:hypothetical protein [uncultured Campylobacter sp.]